MTALSRTLGLLTLLISLAVPAFAGPVQNMDSPQVRKLLAQKHNLFVLDVRTRDEYRQAHLKGAVLIPMDEVQRRLAELPKNRPVLVYCAVGARSATVASFLAQKGFRDLYQMSDGLVGWYKNGFPIER